MPLGWPRHGAVGGLRKARGDMRLRIRFHAAASPELPWGLGEQKG